MVLTFLLVSLENSQYLLFSKFLLHIYIIVIVLFRSLTDVFKHFEKGNEFFCFAGQSNQAVTGIYNLYRASQIMFPGEKILDNAKQFSVKFLREKQAANQLVDKWVITKDLPGEV